MAKTNTAGSASALAITDTFVVASQAAMLALTAQKGDIAIRTDSAVTYILQGTDPTVLGNWVVLPAAGSSGLIDDGTTIRLLTPTDSVSLGNTTALTNTKLSVYASAATEAPIRARGASSQSAPLLELQNNAGTALFTVSAAGNVTSGAATTWGTSTGALAINAAGSLTWTFSTTPAVFFLPNQNGGASAVSDSAVTALGIGATAFGYQSRASSDYTIAFGNNATAIAPSATCVGFFAKCGATATGAVSVGFNTGVTSSGSGLGVAVGYQATANAGNTYSVAIGPSCIAAADSVIIGGGINNAVAGTVGIGSQVVATSGSSVAIGFSARATTGSNIVSIGRDAETTADFAITLGGSTTNAFAGAMAFGVNALTTATQQVVFGAAQSNRRVTAFRLGPVLDGSPSNVTLQASSASSAVADVGGAQLTIAGGQGVGAGLGGSLLFATSAAGGTGTTLRALTTRLTIDSTGLATFANNVSVTGSLGIGTAAPDFALDARNEISIFGASAALARLRLRGFYTTSPSNPAADQTDFILVDNGVTPVLRVRYNDAGVMKSGDIALA